MMASRFIVAGYVLLLALPSCDHWNKMTLIEYAKYMNNNKAKMQKAKTCGNLQFTLSVFPAAYYVIKYRGVEMTKAVYDSVYKSVDGVLYAELMINDVKGQIDPLDININDKDIRRQRIYYMSYDFPKDITMKCGDLSLGHPVLYNFIQSYGLAKEIGSVMAFKIDSTCNADDLIIEIEDNVYGNGRMKFSFDKKFVYAKPDLKFTL
jgi:hypothetical protein